MNKLTPKKARIISAKLLRKGQKAVQPIAKNQSINNQSINQSIFLLFLQIILILKQEQLSSRNITALWKSQLMIITLNRQSFSI